MMRFPITDLLDEQECYVRTDNGSLTFLRQRMCYMNVVGNRQRICYMSVGWA